MKFIMAIFFAAFSITGFPSLVEEPKPKELGKVDWIRDYDFAIEQSKKLNKPVFILFQEVPGCSTCVHFGQNVLSHPLIVDAIENEFVPLAIFNNKKGKDLEILKKYNEPAWNNPVVRIVDTSGKDLTKRLARYNNAEVVSGMIDALKKSNQPIPSYLKYLNDELNQQNQDIGEATYAMYCFWSGEAALGNIEGVKGTQSGFMDGKEVVKVKYDKSEINLAELTQKASEADCGSYVYLEEANEISELKKSAKSSVIKNASTFRPDHQPKYYLYNTDLKYIPMLPAQASKVNSNLKNRQDIMNLLSPSQLDLLKHISKENKKRLEIMIDRNNFMADWQNVVANSDFKN